MSALVARGSWSARIAGDRLRRSNPAVGWWFALGLITLAALISVIVFDTHAPLAFNDDWVYSWSVQQLVSGHGLRINPESSAAAIFHTVWAAAFSFGHSDVRLLRLTILPFLGLAAWGSYRIARELGAEPWWAATASLAVAASTPVLTMGTSFMTDDVYLGLLLAGAFGTMRWLRTGRGAAFAMLLSTCACLERQQGYGLIVAVSLTLMLRRKELPRFGRGVLFTWWAVTCMAFLIPLGLGLGTTAQASRAHMLSVNATSLVYLGPGVALVLAPLAVAAWATPRQEVQWRPHTLCPTALGVLGIIGVVEAFFVDRELLPATAGAVMSTVGLNPRAGMGGSKPSLLPLPLVAILAVAVIAVMATLSLWRRDVWTQRVVRPSEHFLVLLALTQVAFCVVAYTQDRYDYPIAALLAPILASRVGGIERQRMARLTAVGILSLGLAWYIAGEQDYEAWQQARDAAAHIAYRSATPGQVSAGYEANAVYDELPRLDRGQFSVPLAIGWYDPAIGGPFCPVLALEFASPGDPRPGVSYASLASGRIVVVRPTHSPACHDQSLVSPARR